MKLIRAILASVLLAVVLIVAYGIHVSHFRVDLIFHAAIAKGIIAAAIADIVFTTNGYFWVPSGFEELQLIVVWLIPGCAIASTVSAIFVRSLSYILERLQQCGGRIKPDSFEQIFTQGYVKRPRLADVRLTEQSQCGTIIFENGCVLTAPFWNSTASQSYPCE